VLSIFRLSHRRGRRGPLESPLRYQYIFQQNATIPDYGQVNRLMSQPLQRGWRGYWRQ